MARSPLQQTDPPQIGRYRLLARLGAGGMGVVYLAQDPQGRQVAVKVLRPELADNQEFRVRFGREVSMLLRVQGVCTVRVFEADTQAPRPYLVTEFADGPSLSEYVGARGPLGANMLYGLATGLAEALTAIHAAGIVHRDLKPSNVLLTATGPKVIDFGIAQALDTASLTRTGITVGSAGFMAPEQIMGKAGIAADIFTWAVTVAFAASGQSPFGSGPSDVMMYRIMNAAPDVSAVPPQLRPLVEAALAKDPAARPTAPQLLMQLTHTTAQPAAGYDNPTQTILAQNWRPPVTAGYAPQPPTTAPPGYAAYAPPIPSRPARRRRLLLPAVLAAAFVLAASGTALGLALTGKSAAGHGANGASSPVSSVTAPASQTVTCGTCTPPATTPATTPVTTSATTPATTAVSTTPAALPVLLVGGYSGIKPSSIAYSGDGTNVVTGIQWASWTATSATGYGTSDIDNCIPNCAQASPNYVTTTVTLSNPVNGHFTTMTETRNGSTVNYAYPATWAQSAS